MWGLTYGALANLTAFSEPDEDKGNKDRVDPMNRRLEKCLEVC